MGFLRQLSFTFTQVKTTGKVPVQAIKPYKGRRGIAALIRNTDTRRM
jgi:hypothetical protein